MKKISILTAIIFASIAASAQTITTLDWNEMRIDSVLPHYTEVVPLAKDHSRYNFRVQMEYPTWAKLTSAEELAARRHLDELADSIVISTYRGDCRGEGMLDIDFIPIIYNRQTEEMHKLLQCKLTIIAEPKYAGNGPRRAASMDERWRNSSVLANGRWAKFSIAEDGVYSLTPEFLKRMGFNDPSRVKVYGYGGRMLDEVMNADAAFDDLEEIPLIRRSNGDLLFWAYGVIGWDWSVTLSNVMHHTQNPYSTRGYYFVTEGDSPAALETAPTPATAGTELRTFISYWVRDIDEYAYFSGGRRLWENATINTATGTTYEINTPGYSNGTATLRMSIANADTENRELQLWFNDSTLLTTTINKPEAYEFAGNKIAYYTLRGLKPGRNVLRLKPNTDKMRVDFIELNYQHAFKMMGAALPFTLSQTGTVHFTIKPAYEGQNIMLLRLGTRGKPATRIADKNGVFTVAAAKGDYVAIDINGSFAQPVYDPDNDRYYCGPVDNQNLHADDPVDMVIITPPSGIQDFEAQRLADAHARYDGVKCRVVRADKIYNEFSSGTPDATAYRRYVKMLYDRALGNGQEPPRAVLLFGDCVFDNRMMLDQFKKRNPKDYLLCLESENSLSDTKSFVMEDYFALMTDGEGGRLSQDKPDLGVGRFPVQTAEEGRIMVNKTIDHLMNKDPGKWQNLTLFLGDDGDQNDHMDYACRAADTLQEFSPCIDIRKIMWDSYKRVSTATGNSFPQLTQYINKTVNEGAIMFNYVGHGATYLLSHENVLSLADFHNYDNTRQGFWFTAACDIAPFDGTVDNIGEAAVLNPRGGAKCFIGTARTVYANLNLNLNKDFCKYIFNSDPQTGRRYSIGEALALAKAAQGESGRTVNKLHYVILGDPSLVFGQPLQRIVIDEINGSKLDEEAASVKAGGRCRVIGHVEDKDGNPINDFNGRVDCRILDTMDSVVCLNQAGANKAFKYGTHRKVLFEGDEEIKDGKFDLEFVVPMDINYANDKGRAIFYATGQRASGEQMAANGYTDRYVVGGTSDELKDDVFGPKIDVWLDSESFMNGALVSTAPMLFATIADDNGLNYAAAGIGHGIEVSIDDKPEWTFDISKDFVYDPGSKRSGKVECQMPVLTKGEHKLQLRAWDVLNNASTAAITFNVNGTNETAPVSAFINTNDGGEATITIINRLTGSATSDATVHLFDAFGRLCFTRTIEGMASGETRFIPLGSTSLQSGIYFLQVTLQQKDKVYQSEVEKTTLKF